MKQARKILALFQAILLLAGMAISVHATEEITPYYSNVSSAAVSASVSSDGLLEITNRYYGFQGKMAKAVITTYVEKRFLGLFWTRVDIGVDDNQWVDTIYDYTYVGAHAFQLSSTGTYRITTTFVFSGNDGTIDEIVSTDQITY